MNHEAIKTYTYLTDLSFDYGLITLKEYHLRQKTLYELLNIDSKELKILTSEILNQEELMWGENENSLDNENDKLIESDSISFITCRQGVLCKWKFHMYDSDDKPSVPHGHGLDHQKLKLDPFRGNIFDINQGYHKIIKRESKKYIGSLWSDDSFRKLATININYFIRDLNNFNYNWLGIRNITIPFKLPRKRK